MGMLSGNEIERCVRSGEIEISPYNEAQVNPNSYDLCLGPELIVYNRLHGFFDMKKREWVGEDPINLTMDAGGKAIHPHEFVLASTIERTYTPSHVPLIETKSSIARMGLSVHHAGFGDVGFNGQWTLELTAATPIWIYPYLPVCQVCFLPVVGSIRPYTGRYSGQTGPTPVRQ